jgi:CHAT domain-containing protein
MKPLCKTIACLSFFICSAIVCHGQCLSDDSIRYRIDAIINESSDNTVKITELAGLKASYLKCHQKNGAVYAEIIHRLGDFYYKTGDLVRAVAYTAAAVDVNEHTGTAEPFLTNSFYNLGIFYLQLNLLHLANISFSKCIEASKGFPEKYGIAGMAHGQLAYLFFKAGDYQHATEIASKGMYFSIAAKDTVNLGALWAQKAQAEVELGDFKSAAESITKALSFLNHENNSELASAYTIYANFLNTSGKHQECLAYYKKAFLLDQALQNFEQCADDQNDLGYVYQNDLKQEDEARKCFNEGLKIAGMNNDSNQMVGFFENIGVTYWRQNDFKNALMYYQKALTVLPIRFNDQSIISNPTIEMLGPIWNDYYVSTLLTNKAQSLLAFYKQKHDKILLRAALQTFILADRSVDMMRWKQYGQRSKLLWRSQTKLMYEKAIEVCYLLSDSEKAFYFFEKSKSVLLNDQINFSNSSHIKPDEKINKKLRSQIDSLNKLLISLDGSLLTGQLRAEWISVNNEWEKQQNLRTANLAGENILPANFSIFFKQVQQQLIINKQTLIEYFNNDTVVYVLSVTPANAQIFRIPYPFFIKDCGDFLKYCSNASLLNQQYSNYVSVAYRLYHKIFEPLQVKTERVIISPGDLFIPFDALIFKPDMSENFLVKKYSFSYVYSMRVLKNHSQQSNENGIVFLGIAPETYPASTHLQPLTGSVSSLERIETGFASSVLLKDQDAKKSQLLSRLPQSQIIQIYAHAQADRHTLDPVLYMSDTGVLMSDIQKVKCRFGEMVMLSACNTGSGYLADGEGVFSLARGFRLAGIPSTVTNLWQVDSQATYELTESFYKYLRLGHPKDVSLRLAKLDLLNKDQSHLLPYYWGATIVLGDSSALKISLKSSRHNYILFLIPFTALLVLFGCFYLFVNRQKNHIR